jgi:GTP cyclohydrolase II
MQARRYAESELPTPHGTFRILVYRVGDKEHVALVRGAVRGAEDVLIRVHSECFTGEVLGSLRCDCRDQLDLALERINAEGAGVVIYLRQEGRGIGLGNKIRAYALQDQGVDTVDANLALGFEADPRSYEVAAAMLADIGVASVRVMTNNPSKLEGLSEAGVTVTSQVSHWAGANEHSEGYLKIKKIKMGHIDPDLIDPKDATGQ